MVWNQGPSLSGVTPSDGRRCFACPRTLISAVAEACTQKRSKQRMVKLNVSVFSLKTHPQTGWESNMDVPYHQLAVQDCHDGPRRKTCYELDQP